MRQSHKRSSRALERVRHISPINPADPLIGSVSKGVIGTNKHSKCTNRTLAISHIPQRASKRGDGFLLLNAGLYRNKYSDGENVIDFPRQSILLCVAFYEQPVVDPQSPQTQQAPLLRMAALVPQVEHIGASILMAVPLLVRNSRSGVSCFSA